MSFKWNWSQETFHLFNTLWNTIGTSELVKLVKVLDMSCVEWSGTSCEPGVAFLWTSSEIRAIFKSSQQPLWCSSWLSSLLLRPEERLNHKLPFLQHSTNFLYFAYFLSLASITGSFQGTLSSGRTTRLDVSDLKCGLKWLKLCHWVNLKLWRGVHLMASPPSSWTQCPASLEVTCLLWSIHVYMVMVPIIIPSQGGQAKLVVCKVNFFEWLIN